MTSCTVTLKDDVEYTQEVRDIIDLFTFSKGRIVGSAAVEQLINPSDIDIFDQYLFPGTKEEATEFFVRQFQIMAHKLDILRNQVFMTDFKLGLDTRFTEAEHNKRVLRWSINDLIDGVHVQNNKEFYIEESITDETIIKMDIIIWTNVRWVAIEILYHVGWKRCFPEIDKCPAQFYYRLGDYNAQLVQEIRKFSSAENYNPIKVIKRSFTLARIQGKCIKVYIPFLNSPVGALSKLSSDIETLLLLQERGVLQGKTKQGAKLMLLNMELRITEALAELYIYNIEALNRVTNQVLQHDVIDTTGLENLKAVLDRVIARYSEQFLINCLGIDIRPIANY
jgi:hypothetical protein